MVFNINQNTDLQLDLMQVQQEIAKIESEKQAHQRKSEKEFYSCNEVVLQTEDANPKMSAEEAQQKKSEDSLKFEYVNGQPKSEEEPEDLGQHELYKELKKNGQIRVSSANEYEVLMNESTVRNGTLQRVKENYMELQS